MTYNETMLVNRCNQLTMMVVLQELRAQVLARQNAEANAVIVKAAETIRELTDAMCGTIEAYNGRGDRIC